MNNFYQVLEYLVSFIEGVIILSIVSAICGRRWKHKHRQKYWIILGLVCVIEVVFVSLMNAVSSFSFLTIFICAAYFILASLVLCEGIFLDRCLAVILALFVLHTIDYVTGFSFALLMEQTSDIYSGFSAAMAIGKTRAFYLIADKVVQVVLFFLFKPWYRRIQAFDRQNKDKLLMVLVFSYLIGAILLNMIISTSPVVMQSAIIISWIFILLANLVMIGFIYQTSCYKEKVYENRLMKYQSEILGNSYEQLSTTYKQQRKMIHDFKNHLRTLETLSCLNPSVEEYLQDSKSMVSSLPSLCQSGNDYIDAIINYKEAEAKSVSINFVYSIQLANEINLAPTDICTILANQLDNAIEATSRIVDPERRYIQVEIAQRQMYTIFKVENSIVEGSVTDKYNFDTTKGNKKDHGIGISNIRSTVEKHGGSFQMEVSPTRVISVATILTEE